MAENCPKLGELIDGEPGRDAIHIAIAPVTAAIGMRPGQRTGLLSDGRASPYTTDIIGIVDPYLRDDVKEGQRFYLFLMPNTVTSLRHEWAHPAFPAATPTADKGESERWLREFAESVDLSYETVIKAGRDVVEIGMRYTQRGNDAAQDAMCSVNNRELFWKHWQVVTGVTVSDSTTEETVFSCSC